MDSGTTGNEEDARDEIGFGPPAEADGATDDALGFGATPEGSASADALGFGDEPPPTQQPLAEAAPEAHGPARTSLSVDFAVRHRSALWLNRLAERPWAKSRQSLDAAVRYSQEGFLSMRHARLRLVAALHGELDHVYDAYPDRFDEATKRAYGSQLRTGELFAELGWPAFGISVGRQIVAWGQGELISPVDVVNPRDQREPGLADLRDMRVPLLLGKAGWYSGAHRIEAMVVLEESYGFRPEPLSDFSTLRGFVMAQGFEQARYRDLSEPSEDLRSYGQDSDGVGDALKEMLSRQWFLRWSHAGEMMDLALYGAWLRERQGVFKEPIAEGDTLTLPLTHPHYGMLGASGVMPLARFLVRWELSWSRAKPTTVFQPMAQPWPLAALRKDTLDWMAGATYEGITDLTVSLEYGQAHVFSLPDGGRAPNAIPRLALRATGYSLRRKLEANVAAMWFDFEGFFARIEVTYEAFEALRVGVGYAGYWPGDSQDNPLFGLEDHDRVFLSLSWSSFLE